MNRYLEETNDKVTVATCHRDMNFERLLVAVDKQLSPNVVIHRIVEPSLNLILCTFFGRVKVR
jgi:hypothetical protein